MFFSDNNVAWESLFAVLGPFYLLSNLYNYFFLLLALISLIYFKAIKKEYFIFLAVFLFSPFLINYIFFSPSYMPDQFKYVEEINKLKSGSLLPLDLLTSDGIKRSRLYFASYFWSIVPMISFMGVSSLAFSNKFLSLILFSFLSFKLEQKHVVWLFLIPSFILFSSVSLRDFLIIFISSIALIWTLERKFFLSLLMILILVPLKIQNFPSFLFVWIALAIFRAEKSIYTLLFMLLSFFILFMYFFEPIINELFFYKIAFILESGVSLDSLNIESDIISSAPSRVEFLLTLPMDALASILRPFPWEVTNPLIVIYFLENIILTLVLGVFSYRLCSNNNNRLLMLVLFIGLLISIIIHAYTVTNLGTFSRYKFTVFFPFLVAVLYLLKNEKSTN